MYMFNFNMHGLIALGNCVHSQLICNVTYSEKKLIAYTFLKLNIHALCTTVPVSVVMHIIVYMYSVTSNSGPSAVDSSRDPKILFPII